MATVLAEAFGDSGDARGDWRQLLVREVESGRASRSLSPVAFEGERVVGACLVNVGPSGLARVGPTGVIVSARGTGVGRALVETAVSGLESVGARRVTLEVAKDNERAQRLYQSVGFARGRGLRVLLGRRASLSPPRAASAQRIRREIGLQAAQALHPEVPAFQRRAFYIESFDAGVLSYGVYGTEGELVGVLLQRGRDLLDIAVSPPEPDVVAALVWAASDVSWVQRVINVTSDDPVGRVLVEIGFEVESEAWEMVRESA